MTFILDTGSPWMWVPGQKCPRTECKRQLYNSHLSDTFDGTDKRITIRYGMGYIEGHYSSD